MVASSARLSEYSTTLCDRTVSQCDFGKSFELGRNRGLCRRVTRTCGSKQTSRSSRISRRTVASRISVRQCYVSTWSISSIFPHSEDLPTGIENRCATSSSCSSVPERRCEAAALHRHLAVVAARRVAASADFQLP